MTYNSDDTIAVQEEALASATVIVRQLVDALPPLMKHATRTEAHITHTAVGDCKGCALIADARTALTAARAWLEQEAR